MKNENKTTMEFPYKDIIKNRIAEKGKKEACWIKECEDDGFFCETKGFSLMPSPSGQRHQNVYNDYGVCCNSICIRSFKKEDCLYFDDTKVCSGIYSIEGESCVSDEDEAKVIEQHIGEVYICMSRADNCGGGNIELDDHTTYLTLDEVEQVNPNFLRELMFHLN